MSENEKKVENQTAEDQVTEPVADDIDVDDDVAELIPEREFINNVDDETLKAIIQLAQAKNQELQQQPTKAEKTEAQTEKKEASSEYESLRKEIEELKGHLTKQQQQAQMAEQRRLFHQTVNSALDEAGVTDSDARELLADGYAMFYARQKSAPSDLGAHVTKWLKGKSKAIKQAEKEADADQDVDPKYVKRKLADRAKTRGETKGGSAPSREERKFTGKDMKAGNIADAIKRDLGLKRR
jgi:hypothetical protein